MKRLLTATLVVATACSSPMQTGETDEIRQQFCDPVVAAYELIDPDDVATVRSVVVAISEEATELDEITSATFIALGAELQVTVTGGVWSTDKLATQLDALCGVDLPVWSSP